MGYADEGSANAKRVLDNIDRSRESQRAYARHQVTHWIAIVLVILALCVLFSAYDVSVPHYIR